MLEQLAQYRYVDPDTGRELIAYGGTSDGTATIAIYRREHHQSTRYEVHLPREEVARLALALAATAHHQGGH